MELFAAQLIQIELESELDEVLRSFPEHFKYGLYVYDLCDYAIEIYGVPKGYVLSHEDKTKLKDYGFLMVWTNTVANPKKRNSSINKQKWYSLKDFGIQCLTATSNK